MDIEDRDAETRRFNGCQGNRVRYVMIFQIEKHATAARNNFPNQTGTSGSKQLHADLEHADHVAKFFKQLERAILVIDIKCDDQSISYRHSLSLSISMATDRFIEGHEPFL